MKEELWKEIEKDFIAWDNEGHSNASQRQILDWFNKRLQPIAQPSPVESSADTCNCSGRLEFTMENKIIWCNKCRKRFIP